MWKPFHREREALTECADTLEQAADRIAAHLLTIALLVASIFFMLALSRLGSN